MKHIKPGRGPSAMGGIGAVAAAVFGIFWTAIAPGFMKAFGVIFIVIAIALPFQKRRQQEPLFRL